MNDTSLRPTWTRLLFPLALIGVFLAGAFLRFYTIGEKSIWLDEAFSIYMAGLPSGQMLSLVVEIEKHPPLYYLLLHYWMLLGGDSAAWVRSLSAVFSILTLPVIYLAARQAAGRVVGFLAMLILAVNPLQIAFAQETRVYALLTLAVTFATWMVVRVLTESYASTRTVGGGLAALVRPERATVRALNVDLTWLGYIFSTALILYLHNTGLFFPLAVNLFMFGFILFQRMRGSGDGHFSPPSLKNWLIANAAAFVLWAPWLGPFFAQSQDLQAGFWLPIPTPEIILNTIKSLLMEYLPHSGWMTHAWLAMAAAGIAGTFYLRRRPAVAALLLSLFLVPIVGQLLVSLRVPIFYVRALIWVPIPFFILVAAGLLSLRWKPLILLGALLLVYLNLSAANNYYRYVEKERWDLASAFVAQNLQNGDMIIFNAGWVQLPFDYYFRHYGLEVEKHGAPATLFEWGELEPIMYEDDIPRLRSIAAGRERIWLVYSHYWYTDPQGLVLSTLQESHDILIHERYFQVDVYLFGVR